MIILRIHLGNNHLKALKSLYLHSPCAPASDAHALDDVDAKLTDVDEEEDKEAEGAVAPAQEEKREETVGVSDASFQIGSGAQRRAGLLFSSLT